MFENERALNEFMVNYLMSLAKDVDESDLDRQPADGFNPPRWTLGHLAVYTDYAIRSLGGRFHCPKSWHRHFARGTEATSVPDELPTKQELLDRISAGFAEVRERSSAATPEQMAGPHSAEFLRKTPLKTVGHIVSHLMTTHFAAHLGQLSAWRRLNGSPPIDLKA